MRYKNSEGFTLLEVMIAVTVMVIALLGSIAGLNSVVLLNKQSEEINIAMAYAQDQYAKLSRYPFTKVFADFKGTTFDVMQNGVHLLKPPVTGEKVLRIEFPIASGKLVETYTGSDAELIELFTELGMGNYDLNGDGNINTTDCSTTYRILPVRILLRWKSATGTVREYKLHSLLWGSTT